ncbi:MAG: 3-hydroxyacyl-CoA dehydrogenase [Gammaproteobacteria bacterium]|nr:MAG: 3-hydroxyacyl-CoA dehydrogenase [Pseudomonadota bacterium]PIE38465.1 MAG: 3-hydroxyacyl-CoA dehydrogenase [Gammaproteobacteria bacterium]
MEIQGVTAVISGGASGLGEGTARVLSEAGAKVALLDLQTDKARSLAEELGGLAVECNVADAKSAERALATCQEQLGPCGIAVNCAGIGTAGRILGKNGPMSLSAFSTAINVNLVGTFNIMRLAADQMQHREPNADGERGIVINTASIAAFEGQIGQAAYSASKGGVVSLTLPAARELARFGIRVNTIAPGLFKTPMMESFSREIQDALVAGLPFPSRLGEAREFGALVQYMVENAVMNGETVRLDSAVRLQPG